MRSFYIQSQIGPHRSKTPEGYLIATSVPIARTGWQDYKASEIEGTGDGTVRVYRSAAEVFHPSTIASFEGKSITSPHPPIFLTHENDTSYSKGHVQNIRRGTTLVDGQEVLLADLVFKDANLIDMIENHTREELSCGYQCEWVEIQDEHSPFKAYEQKDIRGNHIAVVPTGRAGEGIRVLDEATVTEEEPSMLEKVLQAMGWKPPATAVDSDPGAVERNIEMANKAKERAVKRNQDEAEEEIEKKKTEDADEEEAEEKEKEKKASDAAAAESKKSMDAMETRLTRKLGKMIKDGFEEFKKKGEEKEEEKETEDGCNCGAKEGEAHDADCPMHEAKDAEDSELIPVETLTGEEVPKNPIPGASKSVDAKLALDALRSVREAVASSGDRKAMDSWNNAVRKLKGIAGDEKSYRRIADRKKPEEVELAESVRGVATDRSAECNDFEASARKFHRKNANEVEKTVVQ